MDRNAADRAPADRRGALLSELPIISQLAILTGSAYLMWRLVATGGGTNRLLFVALLAAEAFGIIRLTIELICVGDPSPAGLRPTTTHISDTQDQSQTHAAIVRSTVIVIVDDDPLSVTRAGIIAARAVVGTELVAVIDIHRRIGVRMLAERLGAAYIGLPGAPVDRATNLAATANAVVAVAPGTVVLVTAADHVLLPHAVLHLAGYLQPGVVDAVLGRIDEANAVRRVDRTGLGDSELWEHRILPRLSQAGALSEWAGVALVSHRALDEMGGFASVDGRTLSLTGARFVAAGHHVMAVDEPVARRLAPGPRALGRHRYDRALRTRLLRLGASPRPSLIHLDGIAAWSAALAPLRALQRLGLLLIAWAVLMGLGSPASPSITLVVLWSMRQALAIGARRVVAGDAFEPWILNDLRVMGCDLAAAFARHGRRAQTPLLSSKPAGDHLRWVVRGAQAVTSTLIVAVATGFLRANDHRSAVLVALGGCCWFLTAGMMSRRTISRRQFRRSFRTDDELSVISTSTSTAGGVRVVGLSPTGFDIIADHELVAGSEVRIVVDLPRAASGYAPTEFVGTLRRAGCVGDHWAGYALFANLAPTVEDLIIEYLAVASYRHAPQPKGVGTSTQIA